jgi:hypothetical protein
MNPNLTEYLDQVTAGLKDDTELRLDVRAELASHLDDKAAELQRDGAADSEAQAIAAFGAVTEVAVALEQGNQRRLLRRAWLRRGLRFALVPAAVVIAILCSDLQWAAVIGSMQQLGGGSGGDPPLQALGGLGRRILGARAVPPLLKATPRERWESDPRNRVFYADFVSHDVASKQASTDAERQPLLADLDRATEIDPDNARYDYLRAAILLNGTCEVTSESGEKGPDGKRTLGTLTWKITDRARLDQAMPHLLGGLRKPEFRRYGREMLALRLEAMGPADRFLRRIERIALCAGALLPDLSKLRELARVAYLYGETLATEGHTEEAHPYLDAWRTLTVQLNADSWTLIDCLVVTALAHGERSALVYDRLGLTEDAARTRLQSEALVRPGREWRERHDDPAFKAANAGHEKEMKLYAGVLASMLMPALNEWPSLEEYAASRRLEYVVAMQAGMTVLSAALLLAMLGCLVISLRWRFMSGGAAIPILLVPDGRRAGRILVLGVVLPLALFAGVVLFVPGSGQCYSVRVGMHRVMAEFFLLGIAILALPTWLAAREARRRCAELGLACGSRTLLWLPVPLLLCALALAAVWFVPPRVDRQFEAGLLASAVAALVLMGTGLAAALLLLLAPAKHGLYCGTVARSLIPLFAAAMILISITTRPWLLHAERRLIAADTVLMVGPHDIGFSRLENLVTERLQKAVAEAAAGQERR